MVQIIKNYNISVELKETENFTNLFTNRALKII